MVTVAFVVSLFGSGVSICMLSSPIKTVKGFEQNGSIGPSTITYFCCQLMNCAIWSMYGVIQNAAAVVFSNSIGSAIASYCILVFLGVARREEFSGRKLANTTYKSTLLTTFMFIGIVGTFATIVTYLVLAKGAKVAGTFDGTLGACASVIMLGSPLMMVGEIIRTQNAESLAPLTMAFGLINSILWALYGFLMKDPFISVPNTLCTFAVLFQFGLLFRYGKKAPVVVETNVAIAPFPTLDTNVPIANVMAAQPENEEQGAKGSAEDVGTTVST